MRRAPASILASALALALALAAAACGGGAEPSAVDEPPVVVDDVVRTPDPASARPRLASGESLQDRLDAVPGEDVALVMGNEDFSVGENRVSFLVVREDGSLVQTPEARVSAGFVGDSASEVQASSVSGISELEGSAALVALGPHTHDDEAEPHDHADFTDLYVTRLTFPKPGRYWLLVEPDGDSTQGYTIVDVGVRSRAPGVGDRAVPSDTPTLDDAPAEEITTQRPPDTELLGTSVKQALEEGAPFVVVFATPEFCVSRACGPTVSVVQNVARELEGSGVRFIHVEIYRNNDPDQGPNQWVQEWRLPSEPFTYLVDADGVIRARFEGAFSAVELEDAVRATLLDRTA